MTELHNLYETAMQILEKTISMGMSPQAMENTSVCAILTDRGNVYTALSGSRLENGVPVRTCSEYEAITAMMMSGENRIIGIVTIAFKNRQVTIPCDKCRELICRINYDNITCGIMTDENTALSLQMLINQSVEQKNTSVAATPDISWQTDAEFWGNDDSDIPIYQADTAVNNNPVMMNNNQVNPAMINNNPAMMNSNPAMMNNNPAMINNNPAMINNNPAMMNNNPAMINNNPAMMNNNPAMINNNPAMMNNNPAMMNNNPAMMNNNPAMMNNNPAMMNGYYQQPSQQLRNQNPYDYVQPVPPSTIQRNAPASRYNNVSGNMYVHSSITSQYIPPVQTLSKNQNSGESVYKQKLKDLLKTDSEISTKEPDEEQEKLQQPDVDSKEAKRLAKRDAMYEKKAAKKIAKNAKKAEKKGFFDNFI